MHRTARSFLAGGLAVALLLLPSPAMPVAPIAATLGKDVLRNTILGEIQTQVFGTLAGMGCKGAALAGVLANVSFPRASGGGMPTVSMGAPQITGGEGAVRNKAALLADRAAATTGGTPDATMARMRAMMQAQSGAEGRANAQPPSAEEIAMMLQAFAQIQQAIARPLSRQETIAVLGELAELGVLTPEMFNEARDCILLAPPATADSIGMVGAIIKSMVLPQLRDVKRKLANLSPEEQEELANAMIEELRSSSTDDRKAFLQGYGQGFYPRAIVERVKGRLQ